MSDELQMTDAVRMERAIIRIALLLAPDEAAVGVNFDELPGQVQALVAEKDRLRAIVENPDGAIEALHGRLDEAQSERVQLVAERDRLRAVVRKLWGAWNDATLNDPEAHDHGLDRDELRLLDGVTRDNPLQALALDGVNALIAERDRVRAVVEAARRQREAWDTLAEIPEGVKHADQYVVWVDACDALAAALDQLDGSGVMGGPGPAGGAPTREGGGRLDEESGAVHLQAADAPGKMFPAPPADAIAERDRLRAVVEAAHALLTSMDERLRSRAATFASHGEQIAADEAMIAAGDVGVVIRQLDGTGNMGGAAPEEAAPGPEVSPGQPNRRSASWRGFASTFDLSGETMMSEPLIDIDAALGDEFSAGGASTREGEDQAGPTVSPGPPAEVPTPPADFDDYEYPVVLHVWNLLNWHADQLTGTDFNVIRAWIDCTIRAALFGGDDG